MKLLYFCSCVFDTFFSLSLSPFLHVNDSRRNRFLQGFCYSIFNPTLVKLSEIYDTNLEGISKIFPVRSVGTTLGTLSGEFFFPSFDLDFRYIFPSPPFV